MRKIILATSICLMLGLVATAQEPAPQKDVFSKQSRVLLSPEEHAKKETDRASVKLNLDDAQKLKWESAALKKIKANRGLKEKMGSAASETEKESARAAFKSNRQEFNKEVLSFLNDEQKKKYSEMKKTRKNKMIHKRETTPSVK